MKLEKLSRSTVATLLVAIIGLAPVFAAVGFASSSSIQNPAADYNAKLAAIEKAVEDKRKELGVPGLSLVIVKDDRVIYARGLGLKDVEHNLPVTEKTLFAIGSCSKAFTAMTAVMSVDDGKLSLDDSPRKHLPYFKLQNADADEKVSIRDLLCHRTGLDGTDLAWYTGVLNREEVIRTAGQAKPTAKLGEKFQYQNVMFSAAGEAVAGAQHSTWERLIADRIFKPLGMSGSNTSKAETMKSADFAVGYDIAKKTPKKLEMRDLTNIAPAGAINSNSLDMAKWLRLMLGGGAFEGKRLVSEKSFGELTTKQITVAGTTGYGLGWGVADWHGHKVLTHAGGIDGFNSLVALMPDQQLGFCLLTNVTSSPIGLTARDAIFNTIVGKPAPVAASSAGPSASDVAGETGSYSTTGLKVEVVLKDGKLLARVAGQPDYALVNVGARKYKLDDPAPDGFFITFRPIKGNESESEMLLEQPQGNVVLAKRKPSVESPSKTASTDYAGPNKDLAGKYEMNGMTVEIAAGSGKLMLVVPGQPEYTLVEKDKDTFGAAGLPDSYRARFKRGADGTVTALVIKQPEGEFELKRAGAAPAAAINGFIPIDELMAKIIDAAGGEGNLRRHKSMITTASIEFENQGATGEVVTVGKSPNALTTTTTLSAQGKKLGTIREYFDGATGGAETSFSPAEPYTEEQFADARIDFDFYQVLDWKTLFKSVSIKEKSKLGDEEVYVIVKTPEKGNTVTDYISTKSFLLLKREVVRSTLGGDGPAPVTEVFSDYRNVDGWMVPFTTTSKVPGFGKVIARVKTIKFDADFPEVSFRPKAR